MAKFATRMLTYLGKPFKEGSTGPDAFDCVGLIYRYAKDAGLNIPDTFQSWTLSDYYQLAHGDRELENTKTCEWVLTLGSEIKTTDMVAGDVVVLNVLDHQWPCIYGGQGNAISVSSKHGVNVLRIDYKHIKPVLAVRLK
jgi:hypothetical protein